MRPYQAQTYKNNIFLHSPREFEVKGKSRISVTERKRAKEIKAGVNVPDEVGQKALTKALAEMQCIPVFLDEDIVNEYYNGYCNNILWPSFHYLELPQEDRLATTRTPEGVEDQGKLTRVVAFPIGIDSERFIRALTLPEVQNHLKELKERFAGRKVMLGVDRLDMIKGIPQKILAFEKFLEENAHWRDKVVLLQIVVPTRTYVSEYQKLTSHVHEIVGRINGRFGTLTSVPIHHLDQSVDFHALCALYAVTVALIASLRCSTISWCWCYLGKSLEKEKVHNSDGKVGVGPRNTKAPGTGNGHGKTHDSYAKSIKGHRKPSQSFIDDDNASNVLPGTTTSSDMDIDVSINKGKGKAVATMSDSNETNSQEASGSLAKTIFIFKLLTEILLMYSSSVHVLLQRDAKLSSRRVTY
ncbi:hypothetical protein KIW84_072517 [Lathyrus oleraceus]|uniref:Uncharacterized protein n=1 Tax=Pisum sativum TaxID=3888 RepID=A0A9D4VLZ9_PEA|nr:hypothetical protein KIW84_072517 [Pisum sativum]